MDTRSQERPNDRATEQPLDVMGAEAEAACPQTSVTLCYTDNYGAYPRSDIILARSNAIRIFKSVHLKVAPFITKQKFVGAVMPDTGCSFCSYYLFHLLSLLCR